MVFGYLDSYNPFSSHQANRLHLLTHNSLSRHGNKVHAERLGYEGEGAGDSDVALDHLQLVVLAEKANGRHRIRTKKTKSYPPGLSFSCLVLPSPPISQKILANTVTKRSQFLPLIHTEVAELPE